MYSLRLDDVLAANVDRLADEEGRTRSNMIRKLLAEALFARASAAAAEKAPARADRQVVSATAAKALER